MLTILYNCRNLRCDHHRVPISRNRISCCTGYYPRWRFLSTGHGHRPERRSDRRFDSPIVEQYFQLRREHKSHRSLSRRSDGNLSVARDPQPKQHLTTELFVSCHDSWNICGYAYRSRLPWNCITFLGCDSTRRRLCHQRRRVESQRRTNRSISKCHCNKQVQFRGGCYAER